MRGQVLGDCRDVCLGAGRGAASDAGHPDRGGDGARERVDLARLERQPVIGAATGDRGGRFGHVEAAQAIGLGVDAATGGERPRVLHAERVLRSQEVGVEREDDVGLFEVVDRLDVVAKGQPGAGAGVVAGRRLPLDPLRVGMGGEHLLDLGGQGRRVDGLGEDAQSGALAGGLARQRAAHGGHERAPGLDPAQLGDGLRAVGIVEREDRRLGVHVGAAPAGRVIGVSLDLGGPTLVALDQKTRGDAAERHGGGEEHRLAGHQLLGLPHVGHDELVGLTRAGRDAGQRQRRAHQLEESAPAHRVGPLRGVGRELAVEEFLELGRLGDGFEAAPGPAGRWRPAAVRG